jgi:hypothetical protein
VLPYLFLLFAFLFGEENFLFVLAGKFRRMPLILPDHRLTGFGKRAQNLKNSL